MRYLTLAALLAATAGTLSAQEKAVEAHGNYARSTPSHANSWGAGAQYQLTFGAKSDPVRLGGSLAGDYQKQENGGPSQTGVSMDVTLQPGGGGALTPYVGGSVGENWMSGPGAPSGAKLGLQYILGAQFKPEVQGPLAVQLQVRPGYVRTQEHTVTVRLGVSTSL